MINIKYKDYHKIECGIYKINFPNNKIYIGKSNNIKRRIKEHHGNRSNTPCDKAVRKYYPNINDIDFDIIELTTNYEEREKYWIKFYNATNRNIGYNLTFGGDGMSAGVLNPASKFTEEDLKRIFDLIKNSNLTFKEIAKQYNVHEKIISDINCGVHYTDTKENYPLRPFMEKFKQSMKGKTGFKHPNAKLSEKDFIQLIYDLQNTNITFKILSKKYNISYATISHINNGHKYFDPKFSYPIRKR